MTGYEPNRVTLMRHLLVMMVIIATYAFFITFENGFVYNWFYYCPHYLLEVPQTFGPVHTQLDTLHGDSTEDRSSLTKTLLSFEKLKPFVPKTSKVEKQAITMDDIHNSPAAKTPPTGRNTPFNI